MKIEFKTINKTLDTDVGVVITSKDGHSKICLAKNHNYIFINDEDIMCFSVLDEYKKGDVQGVLI
ncbi:hypothetical protein EJM73_09360 [Clostridium botulinum]|uniref:hypothetical protein n=1 Tax=Clostridium botulinum TaxID=1491 RepID=UPI0013755BE4|nr:hypothetical protein [Clostridium botulinum]NCI19833.1 hypothetical protein [Clostridium botulinum]NCI35871.1 hypothetical protein [Clostridium botulinum]NCI71728.1 hypothetical protein [Clostridium botulinum]NDI38644.1 hypothetical protein [Clostridium botulinum]